MKNSKVKLFTHAIDTDGIGCLILARLAFSHVDYTLVTRHGYKPHLALRDFLDSEEADNYDLIFVTDVFPGGLNLRRIKSSPALLAKFFWFDHHLSSLKSAATLPHHAIIKTENSPCATSIFYDWLTTNHHLASTPQIAEFVELTRISDTGDSPDPTEIKKATALKSHLRHLGPEKYADEIVLKHLSQGQSLR